MEALRASTTESASPKARTASQPPRNEAGFRFIRILIQKQNNNLFQFRKIAVIVLKENELV